MHRKWMLIGIISMSLVPLALNAAPDRGTCHQIISACLDAGFIQGAARQGTGLWMCCIHPIMQGRTRREAILPLLRVHPRIVAACRSSNPQFGQPKRARDQYVTSSGGQLATRANQSVEVGRPDKKPDVARVPEKATDTSDATPKGSADVSQATQSALSEKPADAQSSKEISANQSADTPISQSETSSTSPGPSSMIPLPPDTGLTGSKTPPQTAGLDPKENKSLGSSRFGIHIGTGENQEDLRPLWRDMLKRHAALIAGLHARRMLAPDKKWLLIAGPFSSEVEAAQLCRLFKKETLTCEPTAFAGDTL